MPRFIMKVSYRFTFCLAERGTLAFSWRQWTHRMWCWLACFQCTSQTFEEGGARSTTEARRHMRCRSGTRRKGKINSSRWWGQSRCCRWYRQSGWLVVPCEHLEFRLLHSSCPESRVQIFCFGLATALTHRNGSYPKFFESKKQRWTKNSSNFHLRQSQIAKHLCRPVVKVPSGVRLNVGFCWVFPFQKYVENLSNASL